MKRIRAKSKKAENAYELVEKLQQQFVEKLSIICNTHGASTAFSPVEWFRDEGSHGGGVRFEGKDKIIFNRASVNFSQVQYDDDESKKLASATAISTIIHPKNPLAPSIHLHFSWTEMKDGQGYWRMMADLNPSCVNKDHKQLFIQTLERAAPQQYAEAAAQGDRYFYIPALSRHRGITHFYLEAFNSGDEKADFLLAKNVAESIIDCYCDILNSVFDSKLNASDDDRQKQLHYHTLYLFQVLTLDRGTTSGLLVHDQNDVGIMGSIPSHIDRALLASWEAKLDAPQNQLVHALVNCLPDSNICLIDEATKQKLATCIRQHYRANPTALELQASGNVTPPTVENHR